MSVALLQEAEGCLGANIRPSEWDKAKARAEQKLRRIISREGDDNGTRRAQRYLAQLIAEAAGNLRMEDFSAQFMALDAYKKNRGK